MSKRLTEHFHMDYRMVDDIINRWNEPHRYYHDLNHLIDILGYLRNQQLDDDVMFLTAVFHDIVLDPTRDDNEERSVEVFMEMHHFCRWDFMSSFRSIEIVDNIMKTQDIESLDGFNRIDKHNLFDSPLSQIISRTVLLFKEEQHLDYKEWKEKTIRFLEKFSEENHYPNPDIEKVIEFLH